MQDAFRAFVLGVGILLGLVEGGADPALACRLHKDSASLLVSAEVQDAESPALRRLLESGNAITVELEVEGLPSGVGTFRQSLKKVGASYEFSRAPDGKVLAVSMADAAWLLLFRFSSLPVCPLSSIRGGFGLRVSAQILVNDAPASDSAGLWNYKRPERKISHSSLTEVPF